MKKPKLDNISACILEELQQNARISNQELALKIAMSPSACLVRVRRLEDDGILTRFKADIAIEKIARVLKAFIEVTLESHDHSEMMPFLTAIKEHPNIVACQRICGHYDFLLHVVVRDMSQLREVAEFLQKGDLGVTKIASLPVMEEIKPFVGYPLNTLLRDLS